MVGDEESGAMFSTWLSEELRTRGWDQRTLAGVAGVSQQTVSRWLLGRSTPAGIHLRGLARALATTTDEVLAHVGTDGTCTTKSRGERRPDA
jgi:transcriptional regulator with XRE-family HTH domain